MEQENKKEKMSAKKKLLIVACIVLSFLLVCAIAAYILIDSLLGEIGEINEPETTLSQEQIESIYGDATAETDPVVDKAESILTGKNVVNIMLVGQDRRPWEESERTHSDAMILCTINTSTKTLTMTSFMRDMWVYIPEYHNARMNVPYMRGGFKMLNDTLEYNFGVRADYNVEIDFTGFMKAIDAVNGVEIELTAAEAKYLNEKGNWGVESNEHWTLVKGKNLLNGSQALAYSRIRKIGDDFRRTNRQRTVLMALIEKAKTLSITELYNLVRQIAPMLATDMSNAQILGLAMEMLPMLADLKVVSQRIPKDGEYSFANKSGASVIALTPENFEANKKLLVEAMKEK